MTAKWTATSIELDGHRAPAELSLTAALCAGAALPSVPSAWTTVLSRTSCANSFPRRWASRPLELHEKELVCTCRACSSTGMNPIAAKDSVEFIQEEMEDITGYKSRLSLGCGRGRHNCFSTTRAKCWPWPENVRGLCDPTSRRRGCPGRCLSSGGLRRRQLRPVVRRRAAVRVVAARHAHSTRPSEGSKKSFWANAAMRTWR